MKVEILYLAGCPNHAPAVERVREVLAQEATPAEVVEIEIEDAAAAQRARFPGSPTIRIDGQDVEHAARLAHGFGFMCRAYIDGGRRVGVPSRELLLAAVREARER